MRSEPLQFPTVTVAAVQAAPVFLDREGTLGIVAERVAAAATLGAEVVALPEAFVPGFPTWALVLPPNRQFELTSELYHQAVDVPGPATDALSSMAADHGVVLSVGVTERSAQSVGTMWNSNLLFDPEGKLINHRRKLVPTWAERLVWSSGDGHDLMPVKTPFGRIGVLICGENTNPLARFAMIETGEQLHIASYPPAWPTRPAEARGTYDLTHAIELRSAAHSFEGKLTTIAAAGLLDPDEVEAIASIDAGAAEAVAGAPPPVSLVMGPDGELLVPPLVGKSGIVVASVDLSESVPLKQIHDVSGGYQRFDVFSFAVNRDRRDSTA